jgi:heterodisulfide reductase subunit A
VESALQLKELNPDMNVYIMYRDIRTYGEREYLYRKARMGSFVLFKDQKPTIRLRKMD